MYEDEDRTDILLRLIGRVLTLTERNALLEENNKRLQERLSKAEGLLDLEKQHTALLQRNLDNLNKVTE
jgi:cell shape-determining protein MreC